MKITKTIYLHGFALITVVLALVRCGIDFSTANEATEGATSDTTSIGNEAEGTANTPVEEVKTPTYEPQKATEKPTGEATKPARPAARPAASPQPYHRIWSVPSFKEAFPDSNSVQLTAAQRWGVKPVRNHLDAEQRKAELVYVGSNPYFAVRTLTESIPYLVPRASILLQDIGRAFYDSLFLKGVPLHQPIVTSVLRSEEDITRLRRKNVNASENSCHRFGTTFDLSYSKYVTVQTSAQPRRAVTDDTLKWVLSEVLRDMRQSGRCYVKYEVKQGCFHITVK